MQQSSATASTKLSLFENKKKGGQKGKEFLDQVRYTKILKGI